MNSQYFGEIYDISRSVHNINACVTAALAGEEVCKSDLFLCYYSTNYVPVALHVCTFATVLKKVQTIN
jgi:hypothetical protein